MRFLFGYKSRLGRGSTWISWLPTVRNHSPPPDTGSGYRFGPKCCGSHLGWTSRFLRLTSTTMEHGWRQRRRTPKELRCWRREVSQWGAIPSPPDIRGIQVTPRVRRYLQQSQLNAPPHRCRGYPTPVSPVYGSGFPVTVRVTGSVTVLPGGAVSFAVDGVETAVETLDQSGRASTDLGDLDAGQHTVTASYLGNANFKPCVGLWTGSVAPLTSFVSLNTSSASSVYGEPVTLTASVQGGGGVQPEGAITFFSAASALGEVSVDATGSATLITGGMPVGENNLSATFRGQNFSESRSSMVRHTVGQAATACSLTSTPNPSAPGALVMVIPRVNIVAPGAGQITGTLSLLNSGHNTPEPDRFAHHCIHG